VQVNVPQTAWIVNTFASSHLVYSHYITHITLMHFYCEQSSDANVCTVLSHS